MRHEALSPILQEVALLHDGSGRDDPTQYSFSYDWVPIVVLRVRAFG
jgi:hypothetical protein